MPLTMGFFKPALVTPQVTPTYEGLVSQLFFGGSSVTINNVPFGTVEVDRYHYFPFTCEVNSAITGLSVNGVPATLISLVNNTSPNPDIRCGMFYITGVTGTSGTIEVTFNASSSGLIGISSYKVMNVTTPVSDSASDTGNSTSSSTTIDVPAYGAYIAVHARAADGQSVTWSNATEDVDSALGTASRHSTASGYSSTALTGRNIGITASSGQYAQLAVAIG